MIGLISLTNRNEQRSSRLWKHPQYQLVILFLLCFTANPASGNTAPQSEYEGELMSSAIIQPDGLSKGSRLNKQGKQLFFEVRR